MNTAEQEMTDYRKIIAVKDGPTKVMLSPADTLRFHLRACEWLENELAKPHDGPTVVVTHHAPSIQSIPPRFRADLVSAAYASNLEALIEEHQPALWVHGHSHTACDYRIGATRIIANPKGYPGEGGTDFRQNLIVEISHDAPPMLENDPLDWGPDVGNERLEDQRLDDLLRSRRGAHSHL
ncbi:hypothetical protein GPA22_02705 [Aromatoleum toluvorans]|uniref:Uncharacterized protein n=1 Tax=Aromatoleum toluvorans TaxID=92002 RepID=A0ABX1PT75_9RHOO|nr:hypothetical protein [Aromatoleum toluvorans]NMG42644.1 hypothetical protein [Aromatoleum toluvorans]